MQRIICRLDNGLLCSASGSYDYSQLNDRETVGQAMSLASPFFCRLAVPVIVAGLRSALTGVYWRVDE